MSLFDIKNLESLEASNRLIIQLFYDEKSLESKQMVDLCEGILVLDKYSDISLIKINAKDEELLSRYSIKETPTIIISIGKRFISKILGANVTLFMEELDKNVIVFEDEQKQQLEILNKRIAALIKREPIMLFMKGDREQPRCGFSKRMIAIFEENKIKYGTFDILADHDIRQGIKAYTDWPTFPQVYVNGDFVGGLDIILECVENGEFKDMMSIKDEDLSERLSKLVNRERVMLFMKGDKQAPRCGFSKQIVAILGDAEYGTFDILTDESVRQGLKKLFDWPTYPQLYIKGELIGGLDIIKEMNEGGELNPLLKS